jgi:hypothetical protein
MGSTNIERIVNELKVEAIIFAICEFLPIPEK